MIDVFIYWVLGVALVVVTFLAIYYRSDRELLLNARDGAIVSLNKERVRCLHSYALNNKMTDENAELKGVIVDLKTEIATLKNNAAMRKRLIKRLSEQSERSAIRITECKTLIGSQRNTINAMKGASTRRAKRIDKEVDILIEMDMDDGEYSIVARYPACNNESTAKRKFEGLTGTRGLMDWRK